jgi:hypothetical protein
MVGTGAKDRALLCRFKIVEILQVILLIKVVARLQDHVYRNVLWVGWVWRDAIMETADFNSRKQVFEMRAELRAVLYAASRGLPAVLYAASRGLDQILARSLCAIRYVDTVCRLRTSTASAYQLAISG